MRQRVKEAITGLPVTDVRTVEVGSLTKRPATHASIGGTPIAHSGAAGIDLTQVKVGGAPAATIKPYWKQS
jgi:hypothetical protein